MKFSFFLILLVGSFSIVAQTSDPGWQSFISDYNRYLERKLASKGIPGAAISIVNGKDFSFTKGWGLTKRGKGLAVNEHTRFRLASVSKTFAGSLTAKLASQGKFSLDDPVSKYIPGFANTVYKDDLKVFHILSHSSGLVPNAYDNLIESRMKYPDIVAKLLAVEPICKPGQCYGYQNVMFSLIDDVITKSTNMNYKTWLNEFIFAPLQMQDASLGYDAMVADENYALPHVKGRKRWHTARLKANYYKVGPAAGVNASASDMAIWLKAQLGLYPSVFKRCIGSANTPLHPYKKRNAPACLAWACKRCLLWLRLACL